MLKKTDLEKVKEVAINFIYLDINVNEEFPFIAKYPYLDSPFFPFEDKICNLLEDKRAYENFIETMIKKISEVSDYYQFTSLITKSYKSAFLAYTLPYIDKNDLAIYLKDLWISSDTVNVDPNISKSKYVSLFKKADLESLMNENEREIFFNIPEELEVYRGINNTTKHPQKGLSWTPNLEIATWYANRFNTGGLILKTIIYKSDILAYFEYEKETVINYKNIKEIKIQNI